MTREGMTADEIYSNLTSRGMELKKGVATVLRLQSAWGVAHDEKRWLGNFRHQCHKKARAQQLDAFSEIAKELGVQDTNAWMRVRMSEQAARQARHELALKLMGEHAPTNPERRKLQSPRRTDGPYVKQTLERETTGSDADTDGDSTGLHKRLRSRLINFSFEAAPDQDDDGSSLNVGDGDGISVDQTPHLSDIEMDMDGDYVPSSNQGDEDVYSSDGDDDEAQGLAHGSTFGLEHAGNTMSRFTTASQPVLWPESRKHSTTAANAVSTASQSAMQTASTTIQHVAGSSTSPLTAAITPDKRGKARSMRQSATASAPRLAVSAPTSRQQTNIFPTPQASTQHLPSPFLAAGPATTFVSPTATRDATTAAAMALSVPPLILRGEEAEANKSTLSVLEQYDAAAKAYKQLLEARNENKPLPGSLTGLPPSAKEVEIAKKKLKEVTQAMMLALD